jgi:hypothetical protein
MGSPGVGGPGEGARLPCADGDCGQRAVAELAPAPASAHRIERAGETSREPVPLPRNDMMRICRGSVWTVEINGADAGNRRPRGSSSTVSVGEGEASETSELGASVAGVDEPVPGAVLDLVVEVDISIAV